MGQKTNSNILRLGLYENDWKSKYIENNQEELSFFVYQDIEIKKYIDRFFKIYGLLIHRCNIIRTNDQIDIFVAYFSTLDSISFINKLNSSILTSTNFNSSPSIINKKINKRVRLYSIINSKKDWYKQNYPKKIFFVAKHFIGKILSSLNIFLGKKYEINFVLQNLNKSLSVRLKNSDALEFRKMIVQLRTYSKAKFFKEAINIFLIVLKKRSSTKLLAQFIALNLGNVKRHNYFINFIKRMFVLVLKSNISTINGIKLKIKGRFNGAPRARTKLIQIGNIPLQTFKSKIDYNYAIAFTSNGTFGVQLWISEK